MAHRIPASDVSKNINNSRIMIVLIGIRIRIAIPGPLKYVELSPLGWFLRV